MRVDGATVEPGSEAFNIRKVTLLLSLEKYFEM